MSPMSPDRLQNVQNPRDQNILDVSTTCTPKAALMIATTPIAARKIAYHIV